MTLSHWSPRRTGAAQTSGDHALSCGHELSPLVQGSERLVIENVGEGLAENIEIALEPIGEGDAPALVEYSPIDKLLPATGFAILLAVTLGSAVQWAVRIKWQGGGTPYEETQSVSSF